MDTTVKATILFLAVIVICQSLIILRVNDVLDKIERVLKDYLD